MPTMSHCLSRLALQKASIEQQMRDFSVKVATKLSLDDLAKEAESCDVQQLGMMHDELCYNLDEKMARLKALNKLSAQDKVCVAELNRWCARVMHSVRCWCGATHVSAMRHMQLGVAPPVRAQTTTPALTLSCMFLKRACVRACMLTNLLTLVTVADGWYAARGRRGRLRSLDPGRCNP